ncbi:MAG: hypothetical protein OEW75_13540 [Cyclobacteriaceae bacterium]|nr:hypothetical protein [Cyclobacteriaceae bacterium]
MKIKLQSRTLASGNLQVRFDIHQGKHKGVYGYLLIPPETPVSDMEALIDEHLYSAGNSFLPFQIMPLTGIVSPLYITPYTI